MGTEFGNILIGCVGVMVKDGEFFDIPSGCQFYTHNIARMAPMLSVSDGFAEGVRSIKNEKISPADKIDKRIVS